MNRLSLGDRAGWEKLHVTLPQYDVSQMIARTHENPIWVHFGAGNIFRGFIAALQQRLLNTGEAQCGIVAVDAHGFELIDRVYHAFDNLTMNVTLNADATTRREIIASIADSLCADISRPQEMAHLAKIFAAPSLQIVSFTITEKGYALRDAQGGYLPLAAADMQSGPSQDHHVMGVVTAMLLHRFNACAAPVALVSMDNCSHNGQKLRAAVVDIAQAWAKNGFAPEAFVAYVSDETRVSFPWSMIDKITPRPAKAVEQSLLADGIEDMHILLTSRRSAIAPFVNAERPQYLVIEDRFPNGRPALEKAGAFMTDRDTVNNAEHMKVTTCLNPLHTALAVYGCLLGHRRICEEMQDEDILRLVTRLGYREGLPVVVDPGIISPKAFIDEVMHQRLPNPFIPDDPKRIAADTSQKMGIRFGETLKSYVAKGMPLDSLTAIPLVIAGWMRYLLGVDDALNAIELADDPMKDELQAKLSGIVVGNPASYCGQLLDLLSNEAIFGVDLCALGLAGRIERMFVDQLAGAGAVRAALRAHLAEP